MKPLVRLLARKSRAAAPGPSPGRWCPCLFRGPRVCWRSLAAERGGRAWSTTPALAVSGAGPSLQSLGPRGQFPHRVRARGLDQILKNFYAAPSKLRPCNGEARLSRPQARSPHPPPWSPGGQAGPRVLAPAGSPLPLLCFRSVLFPFEQGPSVRPMLGARVWHPSRLRGSEPISQVLLGDGGSEEVSFPGHPSRPRWCSY